MAPSWRFLVPEAGFHQLQISRAGFVQSEYLQRRANRRTYPMLGFALAQFVRCHKHVLMRLDDLQSTSAATLIVAPVAGLRASRSGVSFTLNLPKPGMEVSAIPRQS